MNYEALQAFVAVAECQNFTRAAQQLYISQPSVSLHIKNLESTLQTTLFTRSSKVVKITPTGKILYARAKQILTLYEQAQAEIAAHHQQIKGHLTIGATFTIGENILPVLLAKLQKTHPQIQLQAIIGNTEEIITKTKSFAVDIGLIEGQMTGHELLATPFMTDELIIVAPPQHELAQKGHIALNELTRQIWVMREEGSGTQQYLQQFLRTNTLAPASIIQVSSNQGVKESVIAGIGLSLLSRSTVKRELAMGFLCEISIDEVFTRPFFYIYDTNIANQPAVHAFIQTLALE